MLLGQLPNDRLAEWNVFVQTPAPQARAIEWISSLLFWGQLLLAVGLYAAVALAPKTLVWEKLRADYLKTQSQLVNLEQQVGEVKKVVTALEHDPKLIQELARIDLDATRPGEEKMELGSDLILQSGITQKRVHQTEVTRAWYFPLLATFAENKKLRTTSLTVAASLVLIAFTFFQPSENASFSSGWSSIRSGASALVGRYR